MCMKYMVITKGQPAPLRRKLRVENIAPTKLMGYIMYISGLCAVTASMVVEVNKHRAEIVSYQNALRSDW